MTKYDENVLQLILRKKIWKFELVFKRIFQTRLEDTVSTI